MEKGKTNSQVAPEQLFWSSKPRCPIMPYPFATWSTSQNQFPIPLSPHLLLVSLSFPLPASSISLPAYRSVVSLTPTSFAFLPSQLPKILVLCPSAVTLTAFRPASISPWSCQYCIKLREAFRAQEGQFPPLLWCPALVGHLSTTQSWNYRKKWQKSRVVALRLTMASKSGNRAEKSH